MSWYNESQAWVKVHAKWCKMSIARKKLQSGRWLEKSIGIHTGIQMTIHHIM